MSAPQKRSPAPRWRAENRTEATSVAVCTHSTNRDPRTIDYRAINAAALACLDPVLRRLAPGGKVVAGEYVALNPTRADKWPGGRLSRLRDEATDARDLEQRLLAFYGVGPVTVNIFLRELRTLLDQSRPRTAAGRQKASEASLDKSPSLQPKELAVRQSGSGPHSAAP